jgi:hypothetical protein
MNDRIVAGRGCRMMRGAARRIAAAVLLVSCGTNAGCAPIFVASTDLPPTSALSVEESSAPVMPKVAVLAQTASILPTYPQGPAVSVQGEMEAAVRSVTASSGLFRAFSLDRESDADYVIQIDADISLVRRGPALLPYVFLVALTLGLVPMVQTHAVVLRNTVARPDGTVLRSYRLEGSISEIHEFFFVFLPVGWVLTPEHAARRLFEDLVAALYRKMEEDRIFSQAAT